MLGAIDVWLHAFQKLQTLSGDARDRQAAVAIGLRAHEQSAPLETVDQTSDVGGTLDQPLRDFASRVAVRVSAAQDAEHVELPPRHSMNLADPVQGLAYVCGGHKEAQYGLVVDTVETRLLKALLEDLSHALFGYRVPIVVATNGRVRTFGSGC